MNWQTVGQSMFLGWFEANKRFSAASELTYAEMPNCFVWKKIFVNGILEREGL